VLDLSGLSARKIHFKSWIRAKAKRQGLKSPAKIQRRFHRHLTDFIREGINHPDSPDQKPRNPVPSPLAEPKSSSRTAAPQNHDSKIFNQPFPNGVEQPFPRNRSSKLDFLILIYKDSLGVCG
jgi:hypothetical protein